MKDQEDVKIQCRRMAQRKNWRQSGTSTYFFDLEGTGFYRVDLVGKGCYSLRYRESQDKMPIVISQMCKGDFADARIRARCHWDELMTRKEEERFIKFREIYHE